MSADDKCSSFALRSSSISIVVFPKVNFHRSNSIFILIQKKSERQIIESLVLIADENCASFKKRKKDVLFSCQTSTRMTTLPPIQLRPILCKAPRNSSVTSSPVFLLQTSPNNGDSASTSSNVNYSQIPMVSLPEAPLSSLAKADEKKSTIDNCGRKSLINLESIRHV